MPRSINSGSAGGFKSPGVPAEGNFPYAMGDRKGENRDSPPSFRAIGSADAQDINRKPWTMYSAGMAVKSQRKSGPFVSSLREEFLNYWHMKSGCNQVTRIPRRGQWRDCLYPVILWPTQRPKSDPDFESPG